MKKDIKAIGLLCHRLLFLGLLIGGIPLQNVLAEEAVHYISPRLQLGIHTQASLDSPVKELISSGAAVEVKQTDKDFSEIKTKKGTSGWIKSKFLTQIKPAELKLKQLEQALLEAQKALAEERTVSEKLREDLNSEGEPIDNDVADIDQVQANEETIKALKAELKAWEQLDLQDKKAHKAQAEKNNQLLRERLAKIAVLATGQEGASNMLSQLAVYGSYQTDNNELPFLKLLKKDYLFTVMIGGVCFFLGIFLMDMINRRRHGGYRI